MDEFATGWEDDLGAVDLTYEEPDVLPKKQSLFFLAFQDDSLKITKIISDTSYDSLWQRGTEEAKANGGFWSVFDSSGRFVDGNVISR
jgi:hypothetical protein